MFFEVIIAPDYDVDALEILGQKKNRIILVRKEAKSAEEAIPFFIEWCFGSGKRPERGNSCRFEARLLKKLLRRLEIEDMLFANKIVKNSKSQMLLYWPKNKQLLASGVGQTSRVDALKQAIEKARSFEFRLEWRSDGQRMLSSLPRLCGDCRTRRV